MCEYVNNFDELNRIGSGGFGEVFKVKDKIDEQYYAIKKIINQEPEQIKQVLREAQTLAKLSGDKVVRYMNSWVENKCVYIKMEFGSDNLKNVINQKRKYFNRRETESLSVLEFYMSSQIFKELVECVQYLHGLQPPIIHRDIKPQNILISKNQMNKNCLKLCDFGLAISHDISSIDLTKGVGTFKYMAPEVASGKYDHMADIYSMGIVAKELFDIDLDGSINHENSLLDEKLNLMTKLIFSMIETIISKRPNCHQILENLKRFLLKKYEIKNSSDINSIVNDLLVKIPSDSIIRDYLENLDQIDDMEIVLNRKRVEFPLQIGYVKVVIITIVLLLLLQLLLFGLDNLAKVIPPEVQDNVPEQSSSEMPIYHLPEYQLP